MAPLPLWVSHIHGCRQCFVTAGWEQETPVWCLGVTLRMPPLPHDWKTLSMTHHMVLHVSSSLLILCSYSVMSLSPAEAASPGRERAGVSRDPCGLSTTWRVLGGSWTFANFSSWGQRPGCNHPSPRVAVDFSDLLPRATFISPIILQKEQAFWFAIKTLWMLC